MTNRDAILKILEGWHHKSPKTWFGFAAMYDELMEDYSKEIALQEIRRYLRELAAEGKIYAESSFNESTGRLSGRKYFHNPKYIHKMKAEQKILTPEEVFAEFDRNPNRTMPEIAKALGISKKQVSVRLSEYFKNARSSKNILVTCRCGEVIPDDNIEKWNGCNDLGEDYGVVTAKCDKCGADHATAQWGEWDSLEDAKIYLQDYINEKQ